jgi:hypothetical protein
VLHVDELLAVAVRVAVRVVAQADGQQQVLGRLPAVFDVLRRLLGRSGRDRVEDQGAGIVAGRARTAEVGDDARTAVRQRRLDVGIAGADEAVGPLGAAADLLAGGAAVQLGLVETGAQGVVAQLVLEVEAARLDGVFTRRAAIAREEVVVAVQRGRDRRPLVLRQRGGDGRRQGRAAGAGVRT